MLIRKTAKFNNSLVAKMLNVAECNVRQLHQQMNYKTHIVHEMFFDAK